jgi:hypothetical protein
VKKLKADLSLMREVQHVGKELPAETLDLVTFTTGIMAVRMREVTSEGIERDIAVSYLSRLVIERNRSEARKGSSSIAECGRFGFIAMALACMIAEVARRPWTPC